MSKYLRMQATAARLIRENGAAYTMRRETGGTKDPIEGTTIGGTPETQTIQAVVLPPKSEKSEKYKEADGSLNLSKVNDILISAQGLTWRPQSLEEIQYQGEWWTLHDLSPLAPDGATDIIYKGFIRRT